MNKVLVLRDYVPVWDTDIPMINIFVKNAQENKPRQVKRVMMRGPEGFLSVQIKHRPAVGSE